MAFGLKHWIAVASILLLGTAIWGLGPYGGIPVGSRRVLPERERFLALEKELLQEAWLYQRIQWRDSLVSELENGMAEGAEAVLGLPKMAADSLRDRLSTAVELQFTDLGLDDPLMPLGFFVFPAIQGAHSDASPVWGSETEYLLHREGEAPYCIVAAPYYGRVYPDADRPWLRDPVASKVRRVAEVPSDGRAHPNTFGLCKFFLRYGEPGGEMMTWLKDGAARFARSPHTVDHHSLYGLGPARGPFGKPARGIGQLPPRTHHCLAGSEEDCLGLVLDFEVPPNPPGWGKADIREILAGSPVDFLEEPSSLVDELLGMSEFIFFALEEDFGTDRFGDFWRSSLRPPDAFQEAFGEPMELWVMKWLRRHVDPVPQGPGVPVQSTFFSILMFGFLVGGAVRMGRR